MSAVLLVFLDDSPCAILLSIADGGYAQTPLRIARFRAVAASSVTCTSLIGVPLLEVTLARLVKRRRTSQLR